MQGNTGSSTLSTVYSIICLVVVLVAYYKIFEKLGRKGWEGLIPIYNTYVLFKVLYGNGWQFLLLLIPFYGIYRAIKCTVDLGKKFHKSTGFIIGMIFLAPIFYLILAFGNSSTAEAV